ncbi:menaquinone-dependent protoporphyrinogen IX dehydrogenase [Acinetobacter sp. SWAC57]|uniref:menaquinone-dependent protoporphyrinogen IX dehydrogenase n=1 Tax=Acinetobacter sp. SWAC57 TaxID=2293834 RepID=UPI000E5AEE2E|nr:menaquinone-dependent protoporphyrinogen IX dehydrogenase [Acinetobacter sp. SWAC57]RGD93477.1 menaquinone-dependent protoporphyrinogen IX dehydrogenase [Acinetobacter sp. SWAC57]
MSKILIVFSSVNGQTLKISKKIKENLDAENNTIDILSIDKAQNINITNYDFVLVGASIRYGKFQKSLYQFVSKNLDTLKFMNSGFFSVCATARKSGKDNPNSDKYFLNFMKKSGWTPKVCSIFAGAILYSEYTWYDRIIIQFIMYITNGPTNTSKKYEFTNWAKVDSFSKEIAENI